MSHEMNPINLSNDLNPHTLIAQTIYGGSLWTITLNLDREDFVWLGTAGAVSENADYPILEVLRYGPTAQEALSACAQTMHERITEFEARRDGPKNRAAALQVAHSG